MKIKQITWLFYFNMYPNHIAVCRIYTFSSHVYSQKSPINRECLLLTNRNTSSLWGEMVPCPDTYFTFKWPNSNDQKKQSSLTSGTPYCSKHFNDVYTYTRKDNISWCLHVEYIRWCREATTENSGTTPPIIYTSRAWRVFWYISRDKDFSKYLILSVFWFPTNSMMKWTTQ